MQERQGEAFFYQKVLLNFCMWHWPIVWCQGVGLCWLEITGETIAVKRESLLSGFPYCMVSFFGYRMGPTQKIEIKLYQRETGNIYNYIYIWGCLKIMCPFLFLNYITFSEKWHLNFRHIPMHCMLYIYKCVYIP